MRSGVAGLRGERGGMGDREGRRRSGVSDLRAREGGEREEGWCA